MSAIKQILFRLKQTVDTIKLSWCGEEPERSALVMFDWLLINTISNRVS
jgi:hypothetical protein